MINKQENKTIIKEVFGKFYSISDESLNLLNKMAVRKRFDKNQFLLQIGEIASELYILTKGAVIAYFINKDGDTYNKNIFMEGNFVGSTVSYLTNTPSKFVLEAIEDSELLSFNYANYRQLINSQPDMKEFYISYLEKNWIIEKEKREVAIVLEDAEARYKYLINSNPGIEARIPLRHIASNLGITPTQLSRIRKKTKNRI